MFISRNYQRAVLMHPKMGIRMQSTVAAEQPRDWDLALPYSKIPGPSSIAFLRGLAPGGKYHKMGFGDLMKSVRQEYGSITKLPGMFGRNDMVFLFDPKDIGNVIRNTGPWPIRRGIETFDYYRSKVRPEIFGKFGGLLTEQGEEWQKTRSLLNPIMMQPRSVEKYAPGIDRISMEFVGYVRQSVEKGAPPGDLFEKLNKWALESIVFITLDTRLNILNLDTNVEFISTVRELFMKLYEIEILPSVWKYYKTENFNRLIELFEKITDIIMKLTNEAEIRIKSETGKKSEEQLSVFERCLKIDKNIAVVMAYDMILAGVDTTSTTAISTLYLLSKHKDKQEILRQEINKVMPDKNASINSQQISSMPYLRACIKEGMRILPIGGVTLRTTYNDDVIKGYQLPKKTEVSFGHLPIYHDDEYFSRNEEFIPERWLKNQEATAKCPVEKVAGSEFTFLPFGFGSRACIGKRFAELEMSIIIVRMIREFELGWTGKDLKYEQRLINYPVDPVKFDYKLLSE